MDVLASELYFQTLFSVPGLQNCIASPVRSRILSDISDIQMHGTVLSLEMSKVLHANTNFLARPLE
jgi:hypothetical protein